MNTDGRHKSAFSIKGNTMKNSSLVLFAIWIVLALLDLVALFANVPLAFGIAFACLNVSVIIGSVPMFIQEFKDRKYSKYLED